jgi:hypothetical protein
MLQAIIKSGAAPDIIWVNINRIDFKPIEDRTNSTAMKSNAAVRGIQELRDRERKMSYGRRGSIFYFTEVLWPESIF